VRRLTATLSEAIRAEGIRAKFFSDTDEPETLAGRLLPSPRCPRRRSRSRPMNHPITTRPTGKCDYTCADEHINENDSGAILPGSCIGQCVTWKKRALRCNPNLAARTEDRIGPRFRLSSRDLSGHGGALFRAFVPAAKALSGAYEEGIAGMLAIERDDQGRQLLAA
jgi:hypothetical protein